MVNNIKTIVDLVVKRIDLVTKFISSLFIMTFLQIICMTIIM